MKRLILALLAGFCNLLLQAQRILTPYQADTMIQIFKLNSEQANYVNQQNPFRDTNWLYTQPFKSMASKKFKQDELPPGNYLKLKTERFNIYCEWFQVLPFRVHYAEMKQEIIWYILNRKAPYEPVRNIRVTINGKNIPYQTGTGGFTLSKSTIQQFGLPLNSQLIIHCGAETYYLKTLTGLPAKKVYDAKSYFPVSNHHRAQSGGYLISNKPVYRIGDSLKFKGYFCTPDKGKPFKGRIYIHILEPKQNFEFKFSKRTLSPGAISFNWKIPDTLKSDRTLQIRCWYDYKGITCALQKEVYLEDYRLEQTNLQASLIKPAFGPGEPIAWKVQATDASGFVIPGIQVRARLFLEQVFELNTDSILFNTQFATPVYTLDTVTTSQATNTFQIDEKHLPHVDGRFKLQVELIDPATMESRTFVYDFLKTDTRESLHFAVQKDTLIVQPMREGQPLCRKYTVLLCHDSDTIERREIRTPYQSQIPAYITHISIQDTSSKWHHLETRFVPLRIYTVEGIKSADSLQIVLETPFKEVLHYRVYQSGRLLKEGEGRSFRMTREDHSSDVYEVLFTSRIHGKPWSHFYRLRIVPDKLKLHIESNAPVSAHPGEEVEIQLRVTDFWNRPVKHLNMTAWGVNKLFANRLPDPTFSIPDALVERTELTELKPENEEELLPQKREFVLNVDAGNIRRAGLHQNAWYHLFYPDHGFEVLQIPQQTLGSEFAVVVASGSRLYAPAYVECDNDLVQLADLLGDQLTTIPIKTGHHQIRCRYLDMSISFTLNVQSGNKYIVSINEDSLKPDSKYFTIHQHQNMLRPDSMEFAKLSKRYLLTNEFVFYDLIVDHLMNQSRASYYTYSKPKIHYIRGDRFYLFGPSENLDIGLTRNGIRYELRTGMQGYYLFNPQTRTFQFQPDNLRDHNFLSFSRKLVDGADLFDRHEADTLSRNYQADMQLRTAPKKIDSTLYFPQHFLSQHRSGEARIELLQACGQHPIMGLWVINDSMDLDCDFIYLRSDTNRYAFNKPLLGNRYTIYVLLKPDRYIELKNVSLKPGDCLMINVNQFQTKSLSTELPVNALGIYDRITEPDLRSLANLPMKKELEIQHRSPCPGKTKLSGVISDDLLQAQSGVVIYAEIAGQFVSGTLSNAAGRFELELPGAGTYQIKMQQAGGNMVYFHPRAFDDATIYYLNLRVSNNNLQAPSFEISNEDFHFSAIKKEYENRMLIKLFDKETQSTLKGFTIRLMRRGQAYSSFEASDELFELHFPKEEEEEWTLIIRKKGYHSMEFENLEFFTGHQYQVKCFMARADQVEERTKKFELKIPESESFSKKERPEIREYTSQFGSEIYGRVLDERNQPLDFASVMVLEGGLTRGGCKTDINGRFRIKPLQPGRYKLRVTFVGYQTQEIQNIVLGVDKRILIEVSMVKKSVSQAGVTIRNYRVKLIDASNPASKTLTRETIRTLPTITTGDFASMQGGVYQRRVGDGHLNIGGDRNTTSVYLIDGLLVRGSAISSDKPRPSVNDLFTEIPIPEEIQVRDEFSDEAFWIPNLLTNKEGIAKYRFRLPDNLTTWKTYIIAMGKKWKHGLDTTLIRVYKPLQAASILPTYLFDHDEIYGRVKFSNHSGDTLPVKTSIYLNQQLSKSNSMDLIESVIDSVKLETQTDTLQWDAQVNSGSKNQDHERWKIPVLSSALEYSSSQTYFLKSDTTWTIENQSGTTGMLIIQDKLADRILEEIRDLRKYKYGCVEQTSSKLRACILEIRILNLLSKPVPTDLDVPMLIQRLRDLQNANGAWGWWKSEQPNWRMTLYAMEQLWQADQAGFQNEVWLRAKAIVDAHFEELDPSDKLYALYLMLAINPSSSKYRKILSIYEKETLIPLDRLYFYLAKQHAGQEILSRNILKLMTELKEQRSSSYRGNFFLDPTSAWFISFELLTNTSIREDWVRQSEKELLEGGSERFQNTFAKATMIKALTESLYRSGSNKDSFNLLINDTIQVTKLPYSMPLNPSPMKIQHRGKPLFMKIRTIKRESDPVAKDSLLAIQTQFFQRDEPTDTLLMGVPAKLKVNVECRRSQSYVMIDVPLPSTMYLLSKPDFFRHSGYAQYSRDRVTLFFQNLPMGFYSYEFDLQPFLSGKSILPAAQASLMYYPENNSNNRNRFIIVR